ncbi:DUF6588 family protein [Mucilaginibacter segetis]|uniref:Uncharacterized protein n=1 Tax=Mucilaginibacter segetis TaxID=2793071 RepID=A0A934ULT0_9SPHI|nr:DUF6588 family protein [Mucilaginibacter segetis]MBK0378280.1 hypothetical protein [Mucilaginibacter segetis]
MKKTFTILAVTALSAFAIKASAQNGYSELIKSSPADATKLVNAYAEPLFKGFGVGMNSGWTNTAKTKKTLRFDLRITATGALVPSADKRFDVTQLGLSNHLRLAQGSSTTTPTIGGGSNNLAVLDVYDDNNQKIDQFTLPEGKTSIIPSPQIQLTIGLVHNTDLTLRTIPKIKLGDDVGSVSMIGFGIKHNILQDFAGAAGRIIPFDLSIAVGYTRVNLDIPLDVKPDNSALPAPGNTNNDFSNQHIDGHFNNFTAQAIVSKTLGVFTPFLAVGYNNSKTNVGAIGNYPITTSTAAGQDFYETFTNPISINEKSINGVRADLGFQLNIGFFRFYTSYSAAQYQSFNAGIGFGI